jgi:hypothetical protein
MVLVLWGFGELLEIVGASRKGSRPTIPEMENEYSY